MSLVKILKILTGRKLSRLDMTKADSKLARSSIDGSELITYDYMPSVSNGTTYFITKIKYAHKRIPVYNSIESSFREELCVDSKIEKAYNFEGLLKKVHISKANYHRILVCTKVKLYEPPGSLMGEKI